MEISEKDIKRVIVVLLLLALGVLAYFVLKPVILSIFGGLILAYVFFPVYRLVRKYIKWEGLAAAIVSILFIAAIFIPSWFLIPVIIQQTFSTFQLLQQLNISEILAKILPSASPQLLQQLDLTFKNTINKLASSVLNSLLDYLTNFAIVTLHIVIVAFVFFFALKDEAKFKQFASEISPLNKNQEKILVKQFKDTTSSILYGHIVAGLAQGILAGIGFLVFGIPNAVLLTVVAAIFGVIPILGPGIIYVPAAIYLVTIGQPGPAIVYLLYNILVVSTIDNLFRIYIVAKKTKISHVIVLIGMVGGLLLFGFLGLLIGPLVLGYLLTLLEAYKNKTLSSFFSES